MKVSMIFIGTLFSVIMVAYANYYTPMMKGSYGYGAYYPVHNQNNSSSGGFGGIFEILIFLFVFIIIIRVLFGGGGLGGFGGGNSVGYGYSGHKGGHNDY